MNPPGMHQPREAHAPVANRAFREGVVLPGRSADGRCQTLELSLPESPVPFAVLWFHLADFGSAEARLYIGWVHVLEPFRRYGLASRLMRTLESLYADTVPWFCGGLATAESKPWLEANGFWLDPESGQWWKLFEDAKPAGGLGTANGELRTANAEASA
jgi:GNAT superfamily N-acetyltransferase